MNIDPGFAPAPVPEPSAIVLLAIGALFVTARFIGRARIGQLCVVPADRRRASVRVFLFPAALALLFVVTGSVARADVDVFWIDGDDDWNVAANWDSGYVPDNGVGPQEHHARVENGGTANINAPPPAVTSISVSGGPYAGPGTTPSTININADVTTDELVAGDWNGTGTINQAVGTTVSTRSLVVGRGDAANNSAAGVYNLGGTLLAESVAIGASGHGTLNVSETGVFSGGATSIGGGTVTTSGSFTASDLIVRGYTETLVRFFGVFMRRLGNGTRAAHGK